MTKCPCTRLFESTVHLFLSQIHTGGAETDKKSLEESSQTALEAVSNMRTVASLQKEKYFYRKYKSQCTVIRMIKE